ncbi:MAG: hypothetical protein HYX47_05070 [Burkholderiales bacterium]|nr:hypothetical protein [Burkholderiales bacterium]
MPRQQRSDKAVAEIAKRFITAAQEHLGLAPADLWRALGYANSSTVHSVTKGETLPDFVRIAEHQAYMRDARGRSLNLHWVITGQGSPVVEPGQAGRVGRASAKESAENDIIVKLRRMKPSRRATLVKFLDEFS